MKAHLLAKGQQQSEQHGCPGFGHSGLLDDDDIYIYICICIVLFIRLFFKTSLKRGVCVYTYICRYVSVCV